MSRLFRFLAVLIFTAHGALAVEPDEVLADPGLEARAREISAGLRCPVCRNESIDESHATVSRDLRLMVRERLVAGDSNDEVVQYVVDRYGEYVLLRPKGSGANLILWIAGPALLLLGLLIGWVTVRRRGPAEDLLTPEEEAALRDILDGPGQS